MDVKNYFSENQTVYHASSPGRLDVMGGIGDYSGAQVLQMPIHEQAHAWVALRDDARIRAYSDTVSEIGLKNTVEFRIDELLTHTGSIDYEHAQTVMQQKEGSDWAAYAIGCLLVLCKEKDLPIRGVDILVNSNVPIGKGVSSSAAIEVAVMIALTASMNCVLGKVELPLLAQKVENLIVGAPCGIMDQLASYLGSDNQLLPILCQPATVFDPITIPEPVRFIGIDSGVRHAVSGASYGDVRTAAFMGYTIIARHQGASKDDLRHARLTREKSALPFSGYLANIDIETFEKSFLPILPERVSGQDFLTTHQETIDTVTSIRPDAEYAVRVCTRYPVYEHRRVHEFADCLAALNGKDEEETHRVLQRLGSLMLQSHAGYSACGLGCEATDHIVSLVREAGEGQGVYGAKITGGGSGGVVCVLCRGEAGVQTAKDIATRHAGQYDIQPVLFQKSSPGGIWTGAKVVS